MSVANMYPQGDPGKAFMMIGDEVHEVVINSVEYSVIGLNGPGVDGPAAVEVAIDGLILPKRHPEKLREAMMGTCDRPKIPSNTKINNPGMVPRAHGTPVQVPKEGHIFDGMTIKDVRTVENERGQEHSFTAYVDPSPGTELREALEDVGIRARHGKTGQVRRQVVEEALAVGEDEEPDPTFDPKHEKRDFKPVSWAKRFALFTVTSLFGGGLYHAIISIDWANLL